MKMLRKLLKLDDPDLTERALQVDQEIETARREYNHNLTRLQERVNNQALDTVLRRNDRVMAQWAGAMEILRNQR